MSNFYQVYYDIQNAPFEEVSYISSPSEDEKETTIQMNHNNPYLTPKFSYVNQDSFLLKNNYVNDENNQNEHNKRRKRCRIIFNSPFPEKSKPQDLFNKSLNTDKKEKKDEHTYSNSENDDNLSIHTVFSCFSFRPDLIEPSFFNKPTPNKTTLQKSTSHEDLEYSDISDDGF